MEQETQTPNKIQLGCAGIIILFVMLYLAETVLGLRTFLGVIMCLMAYEMFKDLKQ